MWNGFKQVLESAVAIVGNTALSAKEMVVGWDELAEGHATLRGLFQKVYHFSTYLVHLLAQHWTGGTRARYICNISKDYIIHVLNTNYGKSKK